MKHTNYRDRPVPSPFQPHPVQRLHAGAMNTQDEENPIRQALRKLCRAQYRLSASFSEDTGTLAALKTPGLVAVQCVLSLDGKPVGLGHGSTVISKLNKGQERALYSCLNGALMSATNSACKTLDVLRLESVGEEAIASRVRGGVEVRPESRVEEGITDRQKSYLLELIQTRVSEDDREQWMSQLDGLSKEDASLAIQQLAK